MKIKKIIKIKIKKKINNNKNNNFPKKKNLKFNNLYFQILDYQKKMETV